MHILAWIQIHCLTKSGNQYWTTVGKLLAICCQVKAEFDDIWPKFAHYTRANETIKKKTRDIIFVFLNQDIFHRSPAINLPLTNHDITTPFGNIKLICSLEKTVKKTRINLQWVCQKMHNSAT